MSRTVFAGLVRESWYPEFDRRFFRPNFSVPALNLLTRAANCAWFCPPPSNRPVAWRALIETQRQAKTPLQLLCLPNAPFVKTIAFRALTRLRSAARETLTVERDYRASRWRLRDHQQRQKYLVLVLVRPGFSHKRAPIRQDAYALGKEMIGRVGDAWISAVERGRDGRWARDCIVSCSARRGFG